MKYIGIDGCKSGWFYFWINEKDKIGYGIIQSIDEAKNKFSKSDKVLIDIPIGLRLIESEERLCDLEARKVLGKRGSSVFPAPSRLSLKEESYEAASETNFESCGRKLSKQTWGIISKTKEVDTFIRKVNYFKSIREMHPEICFCGINDNTPLRFNKKKREGIEERLVLLNFYLPEITKINDEILNKYKRNEVAQDDIFDAMVGSVSLKYCKYLKTFPANPEVDSVGLKMEIVNPVFVRL